MKKALTVAALLLAAMTGTAFANSHFSIKIDGKTAKVKEKASTTISIVAGKEYHINDGFPTKLLITAPSDVRIEKAKLTKSDENEVKFEPTKVDFKVFFTADSPGTKTITGELKFATCTIDGTGCYPHTETVTVDVDVK